MRIDLDYLESHNVADVKEDGVMVGRVERRDAGWVGIRPGHTTLATGSAWLAANALCREPYTEEVNHAT